MINLSNSLTAFVIVSDQYEQPDDIELNNNTIVLSKLFVKYLIYGAKHTIKHNDLKIVRYLLFLD